MDFRVGQVVACIWDDWHECTFPLPPSISLPVKGCVYTIRSIDWSAMFEGTYLRFTEIINLPLNGHEAGFLHVHFRPVVATDISVFKHALAPRRREDAL